MECTDWKQINRDNFKMEILIGQKKKKRYELVFLIINILHHIQSSGCWHCHCDKKKQGKCKMCARPLIFSNFEKDIDRNMFGVVFLESCYSKFCHEPMELYDKDKSSIDCFLHQEYTFGGRDWTSGETWCVLLSESIRYSESLKISKLKEQKLPIPAKFTHTIDLSL